ncbi:TonB family protein [Acinetobacter nectaris]|uniref:TonB C-terminal domain-containing protein n=1 Tax=Acinetobacter nectaris CIP 110549 TaxID=1392540 RepID=V2UZT9_9GAMM|nr:TonB family protein [Acinetobacter nectaris]ESK40784.1 hypothetical protein P256_01239 [Acinetobacter nectaris CIP 110549]MCF9035173.1 TonB family protein [Acinetobacter nectaris]
MSHSSVLNANPPPDNMKKKVIIAVTAVVIGHIGVLLALGQMKKPELKPIHKEPMQVHFVKIQQPPKPLPPEPKEKPKPKKEVKEVKIVKDLPPPPKKVEKIQHVKKAEEPKKVVQQVEKPQPVPVPPVVTHVETKPQPEPTPEPAPKPAPTPPAPPVSAEPTEKTAKDVTIGGSGVQWSRSPKPSYEPSDLKGEPRSIVVLIEADEKGKIVSVSVVKSSGVPALDEKILRAVRGAKFKPYMENGVAYPIKAQQPFDLT